VEWFQGVKNINKCYLAWHERKDTRGSKSLLFALWVGQHEKVE